MFLRLPVLWLETEELLSSLEYLQCDKQGTVAFNEALAIRHPHVLGEPSTT